MGNLHVISFRRIDDNFDEISFYNLDKEIYENKIQDDIGENFYILYCYEGVFLYNNKNRFLHKLSYPFNEKISCEYLKVIFDYYIYDIKAEYFDIRIPNLKIIDFSFRKVNSNYINYILLGNCLIYDIYLAVNLFDWTFCEINIKQVSEDDFLNDFFNKRL